MKVRKSFRGNQILIRDLPPGFRDQFKQKCNERGLKQRSILIQLIAAWMRNLKEPQELNVTGVD